LIQFSLANTTDMNFRKEKVLDMWGRALRAISQTLSSIEFSKKKFFTFAR